MNKRIATIVVLSTMTLPATVLADHSELTTVPDVASAPSCQITSDLGVGSRGDAVHCLQKQLIESGHLSSDIPTGYFGQMTKSALAAWQRTKGIYASGYFGPLSRAALTGSTETHATATVPSTSPHAAEASSTVTHVPHPMTDAGQWPAKPGVSIVAHPDTMSGFNVEIKTENFAFAPQHVNGAVMPNEGHAHLYVNGKKIARVYGTWFHVGAEHVPKGSSTILVTLNANDHSELAVGGSRVDATATVTIN